MLTADFWMLATSYWMLGADSFMLGSGFEMLDANLMLENPVNSLFSLFPIFF